MIFDILTSIGLLELRFQHGSHGILVDAELFLLRTRSTQVSVHLPIAADRGERCTQRTDEQPRIHAKADHAKTLLQPALNVAVASRHHAAMLACLSEAPPSNGASRRLPRDLPTGLRVLPTPSNRLGQKRTTRRPALGTLPARSPLAHGLDDGYNHHMLVRCGGVFGKCLSPGGRAIGANAANALQRIVCKTHGLFELFRSFDPGDNYSVGANVEHSLDEPAIQFGDADERDGFAAKVVRRCSTMCFQSRCPCSASMTTQSMPRATAISVMLGASSVTHRPKAGRSAARLRRRAWIAAVFMNGRQVGSCPNC